MIGCGSNLSKCIILFFLLIYTQEVNLTNSLFLPESFDDLINDHLECLHQVLAIYELEFTLVGYDHLEYYDPHIFKITDNRQVVTLSLNQSVKIDPVVRIDDAVFISDSLIVLKDFFTKFHESRFFNENCKIFIIYHGNCHPNEIMKIASENFSFRVVVFDKHFDIYIPNEIASDNCKMTTMRKLPACDAPNKKLVVEIAKQQYRNFHNCQINVLTRKYEPYVIDVNDATNPGMEPQVMKLFGIELNFTINYVKHNFTDMGYVFENGTHTHLYLALKNGIGNLMIGIMFPQKFGDFSETKTYFPTDYRFFIPKAKRIPPWMNLASNFTFVTWMCLIGSICIFSIFYYFFQGVLNDISIKFNIPRIYNKRRINKIGLSRSFLDVFAVTLGKSIVTPRITINRVLFMSWILFAFVFSNSYETKLLSFLLKSVYENQIKSYEDVAESGLIITGNEYAKEAFAESYGDPNIVKIYKRWTSSDIVYGGATIDMLVARRDRIIVSNDRRISYFMAQGQYDNSVYSSAPIVGFYSSILLEKGHPLKAGLNVYITKFLEYGIFDEITKSKNRYTFSVTHSIYQSIKIEHVLGAFILYIIGTIVGIIIFIMENLWKCL